MINHVSADVFVNSRLPVGSKLVIDKRKFKVNKSVNGYELLLIARDHHDGSIAAYASISINVDTRQHIEWASEQLCGAVVVKLVNIVKFADIGC